MVGVDFLETQKGLLSGVLLHGFIDVCMRMCMFINAYVYMCMFVCVCVHICISA